MEELLDNARLIDTLDGLLRGTTLAGEQMIHWTLPCLRNPDDDLSKSVMLRYVVPKPAPF
jgi:hypothetical protein